MAKPPSIPTIEAGNCMPLIASVIRSDWKRRMKVVVGATTAPTRFTIAAVSVDCGDAAVIIGARRMHCCGGGRRSDAEGTSAVDATNKRPNIGDRDARADCGRRSLVPSRLCAVVVAEHSLATTSYRATPSSSATTASSSRRPSPDSTTSSCLTGGLRLARGSRVAGAAPTPKLSRLAQAAIAAASAAFAALSSCARARSIKSKSAPASSAASPCASCCSRALFGAPEGRLLFCCGERFGDGSTTFCGGETLARGYGRAAAGRSDALEPGQRGAAAARSPEAAAAPRQPAAEASRLRRAATASRVLAACAR